MVRALATVALFLVVGCSYGDNDLGVPDHGEAPTLTGALVGFETSVAVAANTAALPIGFTGPLETVCAEDVTRGFIAELIDHGFADPQVAYEWAPVVPGPAFATSIQLPEFYASGTVTRLDRSGLDFRPPHPFGFDTTWDFRVDAPFLGLVHNRPGDINDGDAMHAELESGLYPDALFGIVPTAGDRVAMKGGWILDCGHPPYEAEIHPPTFVAVARTEGTDTIALAFANPYRSSQLYGLADDTTRFSDDTRFSAMDASPFTRALTIEIIQAALGEIPQFELHDLIEAIRVEPVTWFVCAPPRRSPSAQLRYSFRFVARSGIAISAATRGDSGCLEFHAEAGAGYKPFVPDRLDHLWTWAEINSEASSQAGVDVDVRQLIVDAVTQQGLPGDAPALRAETATVVDEYMPLQPRSSADSDSPTAVIHSADDQPFPFYGRVRIGWK
ncbi:MAG TPA: hypothetical protein VIX73_17305 [Kofleriaceae bacterium]|jgi:hypothetical protein